MVTIRLKSVATGKNRIYKVAVADSRRAVSGKFIEIIGHYTPLKEDSLDINKDRYAYWVSKGAQPTLRVKNLYKKL